MSLSFAGAGVWGLAVLAAFVGWGGEIGARLFGKPEADTGLRAAWGMALAVFAGGLACLFDIASRGMIFAFVAAGVSLACVRWLRNRGSRSASFADVAARWYGPAGLTLVVICVALAFVQYLISIGDLRFNRNDDLIAYFPFAKQILQQGTLFDPFSTRRVMSFGGQSLLHAIVLAGLPAFRLHMFDEGICLLMAVLLVIGDRTRGRPAWPQLLALLLLITLPSVRINTYPEMAGVVVFYGLYRTLVWLDEREEKSSALCRAAIVALLATAACALRSNYIAVAVPMVAISYASFLLEGSPRGPRLREAAYCAAFGLLFLAPWMFLSYRSSGTPLFPLLHGNFNDAFPMLQDARNWRQQLSDLLETFRQNRVLSTFPLFVVAGFLLPERGSRRALPALLIAGLAGWVLLVSALAADVPNFLRYVYGFMVAGALAVAARCSPGADSPSGTRRLATWCGQAVGAAAVLIQLYAIGIYTFLAYGYRVRALPRLAATNIQRPEDVPVSRRYQALQDRVPPGARLLVMVDYPFLLDFGRNEIYNVDTAAAVSPPPGFPYFQGPEQVTNYLRSLSIRYVAFVTPDTAVELYRRDVWKRHAAGAHPLWRAQSSIYLDVFDNFEKLATSHENLYHDGSLVLVDLARAKAGARSLPRSAGASRPPG